MDLRFTGSLDTDAILLLSLPLRDVLSMCSSNEYLNSICQNEIFWSQKTSQDFGPVYPKLKPITESYAQQYRRLLELRNRLPETISSGNTELILLIESIVKANNLDSVNLLLDLGESPYVIARYAMINNNISLFDLLISRDWIIPNDVPYYSLAKDTQILDQLIERGWKPDSRRGISVAVRNNRPDILEWLDKNGLEVPISAVFEALFVCALDSLEWLYQKYRNNPDFRTELNSGLRRTSCPKEIKAWMQEKGFQI